MLRITPWHRPACGHNQPVTAETLTRPACGYTSSWRVKPLDAHQPVTPETLTKAARDTISPQLRRRLQVHDRKSVLQRGQEKEAALEAGYGMADYVR